MNNKTKTIIIGIVAAVGLLVLPYAVAQQANDYRAFVLSISPYYPIVTDGSNVSMRAVVMYVPIYPSTTYTFTSTNVWNLKVDVSQPTQISQNIATQIKNDGNSYGYNVIRVFVPSYEMRIP